MFKLCSSNYDIQFVLSYISLFILISLFPSPPVFLGFVHFCILCKEHLTVLKIIGMCETLNFANELRNKSCSEFEFQFFSLKLEEFSPTSCALHSSMQTVWSVTVIEVCKVSMNQLIKFYSFIYSGLWKLSLKKMCYETEQIVHFRTLWGGGGKWLVFLIMGAVKELVFSSLPQISIFPDCIHRLQRTFSYIPRK
jgi:hypothetical protein